MSLTQQQFDNLKVGDTVYKVLTDDVFMPIGVVKAKIVDTPLHSVTWCYQDETDQTVTKTSPSRARFHLRALDAYKELAQLYRGELNDKIYELQTQSTLIEELKYELEDKDQELKDLKSEVDALKDSFEGLEYEVIALKSELYDRDSEVQELRSTLDELNAEIDSLKV